MVFLSFFSCDILAKILLQIPISDHKEDNKQIRTILAPPSQYRTVSQENAFRIIMDV